MTDDNMKEEFKGFLEMDMEFPEGSYTCAYCQRSLLPDDPLIEMEYRVDGVRYLYRFCQQSHAEKGFPPDECPSEGV